MTIDHRVAMQTFAAMSLVCAAGAPASAQVLEATGSQEVVVGSGESYDLAIGRDQSIIRLQGGSLVLENDVDLDANGVIDAYGVSATVTDSASLFVESGAAFFGVEGFANSLIGIVDGAVGAFVRANGATALTISGGDVAGPLVVRDSAVLHMSGGEVGGLRSYGTSQMTLAGGLVSARVEVDDDSTLYITGGDVGGNATFNVTALDNGTIIMQGGTVRGNVGGANVFVEGGVVRRDLSGATLRFSGGIVEDDVRVYGQDSILSGGRIDGALRAYEGARPIIRAKSFFHDHDNDPATPLQAIDTYGGVKNLPYTSSLFSYEAGDQVLHDLTVVWENGEVETFDFVGDDTSWDEWYGQLTLEIVGCVTDLSGDGFTDGADLGLMLGQWGQPGVTDFNADGVTDGADLGFLLGAWGVCGSN